MTKLNLPTPGDRRMVIRRTSNERGVLVANGKSQGCVVKDISSNGARLQLGGPNPLPQRFQLELTGRGERVGAQLVWQNGTEAGVQFLPHAALGQSAAPFKIGCACCSADNDTSDLRSGRVAPSAPTEVS